MKKLIPILLALIVYASTITAQNTISQKPIFKTLIHTYDNTSRGYISHVNDSAIIITKSPVRFDPDSMDIKVYKYNTIRYDKIEQLTYAKKGGNQEAALLGAMLGMAGGLIIAVQATRNDGEFTALTRPALSIVFGSLAGGIGALFGSQIGKPGNKTFKINRSKDNFKDMRQDILNSAYADRN